MNRSDLRPAFRLETRVAAARERVHAFLLELENLMPLHPLIESIERLPDVSALPKARRYRVVDRIPVGPLRLRSVYSAALESISDEEVQGIAWQAPGIVLRSVYALHSVLGGSGGGSGGEGKGEGTARDGVPGLPETRIEEEVFIEAPWPMRRYVTGQARRAHAEMLAGIRSLLEQASREDA